MNIGELTIWSVTDGTFIADPEYFGANLTALGHEDLFRHDGKAFLPIGAFLIESHGDLILVDAGMGPFTAAKDHRCQLIGGQLITGLRTLGAAPSDIKTVVCTHLHSDHVGWLFDVDGAPVFDKADIVFGEDDWDHFIAHDHEYTQPQIREGFRAHADTGRLRPIDTDTLIATGITAIQSPGHTPGHLCVVLASGTQRAILLGDAITCPVQLDEASWHSMGDVDPDLADRTRERLWRELEGDNVTGAGAHFPELKFGRVIQAQGRRWWS